MPKIENLRAAVLDTHAWVWASMGDARAGALKIYRGGVILSAISLWEVAMLESKGRLALKPDLESWISANLASPVSLEPLSPDIAIGSSRLPDFHGDPADRIIVSTAIALGIPLITADQSIIQWGHSHPHLNVIAL